MENFDEINENNLGEIIKVSLNEIYKLYTVKQLNEDIFSQKLEKIVTSILINISIRSTNEINNDIIYELGNVNIFLPLFEIFYEFQKDIKIDCSKSFELILKLLEVLLSEKHYWFIIQKNKFIYIISLFFEKFNDYLYQNGKYFEYISKINFKSLDKVENDIVIIDDYCKFILFNYTIFKKLNKQIQNKYIKDINIYIQKVNISYHIELDKILLNFEEETNGQIWKFSKYLIKGYIFSHNNENQFLPLQYCLIKNNIDLLIEILSIYNEVFSIFPLTEYENRKNTFYYFIDSNYFNQVISLLRNPNLNLKFKIIELLFNLTFNFEQKGSKIKDLVFIQKKNGKENKITKDDCIEFIKFIKNKNKEIEREFELDTQIGTDELQIYSQTGNFFEILKSLLNSFLNLSLNKFEKSEYSYVDEFFCEKNYKEIIDNIHLSIINYEKGKKNFFLESKQAKINNIQIPRIFNFEKNEIRRELIRLLRSLIFINQEKFFEYFDKIYFEKFKECKLAILRILFDYSDSSTLKLLTKSLFYFMSSFALKHFSKHFLDNMKLIEDFIYEYIQNFNNGKYNLKPEYEENFKKYMETNKIIKDKLKLDKDGIYTYDSLLEVIMKTIEEGKGKKLLEQNEMHIYGDKGLILLKSLINIICYPIQESKNENFENSFKYFQDKFLFICISASLIREEHSMEMNKHFLNLISVLLGILIIYLKNETTTFYKKTLLFIFRILQIFKVAKKNYKNKHFFISIVFESHFTSHPISNIWDKIINYYNKKKDINNLVFENDEEEIADPSIIIEDIAMNGNLNNLSHILSKDSNFVNFIYTFQFNYDNVDQANNPKLLLKNYDYEEEIENNENINNLITDEKYDFTLFQSKINSRKIFEFIHALLREKEYVKNKKILFSWNGFYSDLNLFLNPNERLKYKLSYHLSKDFSIQIIKPIVDFYNYYPSFPKYNIEKIFKDDYHKIYNINTKIFESENFENYFQKEILTYQFNEIKIFQGYLIKTIISILVIIMVSLIDKNIYIFHIPNKENKNELKCSLFDYENKNYITKIKISEIKFITKKYINFYETGLEIFHKNNNSFLISFLDELKRTEFLSILQIQNPKFLEIKDFGLINPLYIEKQYHSINSILILYQKRKISSLEYLMWLNIYSNRSYKNIHEYPVFPWVISNYKIIEDESKKLNDNNLEKRDLTKPMGMLEISERGKKRKEQYINVFIETYNIDNNKKYNLDQDFLYNYNIIDMEEIPHIFGSHYSNPAYVTHYNVRLFPYTFTSIQIQENGFDIADRLFINIDKSYINCCTEKSDIRELIPEFYFLPEIFININNLNLGKLQIPKDNILNVTTYDIIKQIKKIKDKNVYVDDVLLPYWSGNNQFKFIYILRKYLERNEDLNDWIDLIFGVNQGGYGAFENYNIFMPYCYIRCINERIKNNKVHESYIFYLKSLIELGVNPIQILKEKCFKRDEIKSKNIEVNNIKFELFKEKENLKILYSKIYGNFLYIFFGNYELNKYSIDSEKNLSNGNIILKINNKTQYSKKYIQIINNVSFFLVILLKKKKQQFDILTINNTISIIYNNNCDYSRSFDNSPYSYLISDEVNNLIYCGTQKGTIFIYQILKIDEKYIEIHCPYIFKNHSKKILCINYNNHLNLFADTSSDGFINLYKMPKGELIRIYKTNDYIFDNVYFSESYLGCLCLYSINNNEFVTYSLNGSFLHNCKEEFTNLIFPPFIISDVYFSNHLCYFKKIKSDIFLFIKTLPYFELINRIKINEEIKINDCKIIYDKEDKFIYIIEKNKIIKKIRNIL